MNADFLFDIEKYYILSAIDCFEASSSKNPEEMYHCSIIFDKAEKNLLKYFDPATAFKGTPRGDVSGLEKAIKENFKKINTAIAKKDTKNLKVFFKDFFLLTGELLASLKKKKLSTVFDERVIELNDIAYGSSKPKAAKSKLPKASNGAKVVKKTRSTGVKASTKPKAKTAVKAKSKAVKTPVVRKKTISKAAPKKKPSKKLQKSITRVKSKSERTIGKKLEKQRSKNAAVEHILKSEIASIKSGNTTKRKMIKEMKEGVPKSLLRNFSVKIKHQNGYSLMNIKASSEDEAKMNAIKLEQCPENAIVSVKEVLKKESNGTKSSTETKLPVITSAVISDHIYRGAKTGHINSITHLIYQAKFMNDAHAFGELAKISSLDINKKMFDVIVPINTRNSKFNVPFRLAQAVGNLLKIPVVVALYDSNTKCKETVKGLRVLVFDDVIYTGKTMKTGAKSVKKAGAKSVHCFAVAHSATFDKKTFKF